MKQIIPVAVVSLTLVCLQAFAQDQKAGEGKAAGIQGTYQIIGGQEGEKKIPAEELKDNVVRITENVITVYDKEKQEVYAATYKLDTSKEPWVLHMVSTLARAKGVKTQGLIQKEGDTVKLIYALPGGEAPKDFQPEAMQQLFILKERSK